MRRVWLYQWAALDGKHNEMPSVETLEAQGFEWLCHDSRYPVILMRREEPSGPEE